MKELSVDFELHKVMMRSMSSVFLRASAIILPDHRAVSNARCGQPQKGEGGVGKQEKVDKGRWGRAHTRMQWIPVDSE